MRTDSYPNDDEETIDRPGAVESWMLKNGIPLTRENWIDLAYPGNLPTEWTQELENELPRPLRRDLTEVEPEEES